jgi:hypothetical protein
MASASISARRSQALPWETIVAVLAVVSLALWPVEIHRAFGLPAHPLILHVPVIFVPILGLVALAAIVRPQLHGPALAGFSVATLAATLLTVGAGEAFRADRERGFPGGGLENATLNNHAEAGETLRWLMVILTALLVGAMFARARGALRRGPGRIALDVLIGLTAVACIFFVIRTGHLGAKLAWGQQGFGGGPPAGFNGGPPPGGGG